MKKVALYARVSTEEQAKVEEGSIKNQIGGLEKYVEGENLKESGKWGVVVDIYKDEGFSGKSLERPEIKRLLKDISKNKIDTVIITEISRMSRSVRDWIDLRAFFDDNEAAFISIRQKFDTSNAMGRAMLNFAIEFAQLEREITAERVKISYQARAGRGLWPGGPVPYGLDLTPDRPGYLQVNAAKQIIAEEILDIFLNRAGYVAKALTLIREAGYKRDHGLDWDESSLIRWIRHRAIIGEVDVNRKTRNKDQARLPEADRHRVVQAVWSPVVAQEKWLRANSLLDENYRNLKVPKWKHHEFLLTGLIECPEKVRLIGGSGWGRSKKKYVQYRHLRKCKCHFHSFPADSIESIVIHQLKKLAKTPDVVTALVAKANEEFKSKQPDYKEALQALNRRLECAIKKIDRVMDQVLEASLPEEKRSWTDKLQRLQHEKQDIENQVENLKIRMESTAAGFIDENAVRMALDRFEEGFDGFPIASKQALLKSLLEKIEVKKDEVVLHVKNPGFPIGPLETKIPRTGCGPGDHFRVYRNIWGDQRGLNPRHPESQSGALPAELWPPYLKRTLIK